MGGVWASSWVSWAEGPCSWSWAGPGSGLAQEGGGARRWARLVWPMLRSVASVSSPVEWGHSPVSWGRSSDLPLPAAPSGLISSNHTPGPCWAPLCLRPFLPPLLHAPPLLCLEPATPQTAVLPDQALQDYLSPHPTPPAPGGWGRSRSLAGLSPEPGMWPPRWLLAERKNVGPPGGGGGSHRQGAPG